MNGVAPINAEFNITNWNNNHSLIIALAKLWNKHMPRGKGAVPRYLGNSFKDLINNKYITIKHGAKLCVDPGSLDVFVHILNNGLSWDEPVFDACRSYLNKGDIFLDLGANIGYFSIQMSKIFEGEILVYAIEPQTDLAHSIYFSKMLNNFHNLEVFDLMIGDSSSESSLYIGQHTIHASSVPREKNIRVISKSMETIDSLVERNVIQPPSVIKMDIEGGELKAFHGMQRTLKKYKPIIIFESDINMRRHGYTREDILSFIKRSANYEFEYIDRSFKNGFSGTNTNERGTSTDVIAKPIK